MKSVNEYHWVGRPNFGDAIAPYLISRFCPNLSPIWSPVADAEVVTVGSVLEHIPSQWPGYVLGAGRLYPDRKLWLDGTTTVLGLRGPLTAAAWGSHDIAIGDPGLLADELVGSQSRIYDLGIVSHWSDTNLAKNPHYFGKWSTVIIDPTWHPLEVIRYIGQCKKIVSSSLHGIIVADAFGIPRKFEYTPRFDKEGGLFKFIDYSASIGAKFEVGKLIRANAHRVDDRKSELYDAYRLLDTLLDKK